MPNRGRMLQVVKTFDVPYQADIARAKLFANGIHAEIANAAVAGWNPFVSRAIGGVTLMVAAKDIARAKKILG